MRNRNVNNFYTNFGFLRFWEGLQGLQVVAGLPERRVLGDCTVC